MWHATCDEFELHWFGTTIVSNCIDEPAHLVLLYFQFSTISFPSLIHCHTDVTSCVRLCACLHITLAFVGPFTSCSIGLASLVWWTDDLWTLLLHFHSELPNAPCHRPTSDEPCSFSTAIYPSVFTFLLLSLHHWSTMLTQPPTWASVMHHLHWTPYQLLHWTSFTYLMDRWFTIHMLYFHS